MPTGDKVTFLVKGSDPKIYFMDNGQKHWIPNPDIFYKWGLKWSQVRIYSDELLNSIYGGPNLTLLIKGSSPAIYLMDNGQKRWIKSPEVFARLGLNWADVRIYSDLLINNIWTGAPIQ